MFGSNSSSQYLHPDYASPLPTTLDAKNSPLALLAQTCSSIGHDVGPLKSRTDEHSKKEGQTSQEDKKTPEQRKHGLHPVDKNNRSGSSGSHNNLNNNNNNNSKTVTTPYNKSNKMVTSSNKRDESSPTSCRENRCTSTDKYKSKEQSYSKDTRSGNKNDRTKGSSPSMHPHPDPASLSPSAKSVTSSTIASSTSPSLPAYSSSLPPLFYPGSALPHPFPSTSYPFPFDIFSYSAAAAAAAASLAAQGKNPHNMASYLGAFSRPSSSSASIEMCKDPYCSHCQPTPAGGSDEKRVCPHLGPSCVHCASKSSTEASAASNMLPSPGSLSNFPLFPGVSASSLYPFGTAGSSQLPGLTSGLLGGHSYVCPVMMASSGELCGKRCSGADDFIQHLRTHTPPAYNSDPLYSPLNLASLAQRPYARSFYPFLEATNRSPYPHLGAAHASLLSSRFHPYKPSGSVLGTDGLPSPYSAQALEAYRTLHAQRALGAIAP